MTGLEREGQIILEGSCLAVGADGSGSYGTGGALAATFGYDSYGLPSSTVTGSVQHYSYSFDPVKGNLLSRKNEKNGMQEGFSYDSLDRLTWVSRGSSPFHNTVYDDNGNITSKSDAGTLSYENSNRPFQVTKLVSNNTSYGANQTVSYNSFEKVSSIGEGSYGATFVYDSAGERVKMNVTQNGASILARTYIGSRYIREVQNGVTKEYTFIGGDGYSAPAVIMQQGGVKTRYYLLRDHLGSVTHVVDNSGSVLNEYSFDAWGRQRNVSTWIHYAADTEPALFMGRGYTGHEHLPWFNLVNMNGRLYDPVVGRFLSPDPFVQLPEFSQNFNRYSYCLNNPLKYNDPDGYKKKRPEEDERFDIMEYAHYLNSRVGGSGGSYGRVGFSGASGGGSGPGAYTYNSYTGNYYNSNGVSVPFEVVYNNYIIPNSSAALWYIHQSSTKGHTSEVMADGFKLDGVIYEFANPIPYSSIGKQVGYAAGQGGSLGTNLGYVNDGLNAVGTVAGGAELFTQANAGARITYTTLNGASSWVSSAKVVSTFKAVGTYTFVGSVVVDLTLGATGYQTPGKTVTNIGVGIGAWAIGGIPGIIIGVGYTVLDKTGCFDGPSGPINYTPPSIAMPDATRVAPPMLRYP